jgi:hypothetical protein
MGGQPYNQQTEGQPNQSANHNVSDSTEKQKFAEFLFQNFIFLP